MYCPKCGKENPDDGKFCRKCGKDLSGIMDENPKDDFALEDWLQVQLTTAFEGTETSAEKKDITSWESAMGSLFIGISLIVVSTILSFQAMGQGWWFWLMIPGFFMIGMGVAMIIKLEKVKKPDLSQLRPEQLRAEVKKALSPGSTEFADEFVESADEKAKVKPPSVVENTTRHLEIEPEGETNKLSEE